ncbi:MAG: hypothetical protein DRZ80_06290 [Thermoprotei archaeon]|nr:MAG: hypothetical protein DRZ80_06290 [Thermoprotei archaeon]
MSKISDVAEARKKLEDTLRLIVESDDNLLGAMIVDTEEGLPLIFVPKSEAFDVDVGPSGEEEEALGGTILHSFDQIQKLISKDRLNLGNLRRVLIEGDKGVAILYPMEQAQAVLLLYGKRGIKVGFIYTILSEIISEMETLSKLALSGP